MKNHLKFDFLVVGSGFAGSITAMALSNSGFSVCLVEKDEHPRFAIGESSTPIADMILRDLADSYDLPFLKEISRYGEWQQKHPEVICGLKRGFSYYPHQKGKPFRSNQKHEFELLVAASKDNDNSDTNWLRSDVDHFLIKQVQKSDVKYLDHTSITNLNREGEEWQIRIHQPESEALLKAGWIIDATGSPEFSKSFLGTESSAKGFETNSSALFSHFENVKHWMDFLKLNYFYTDDYPYNPDHSALHHLIEEGWIWMLRFNNDLLSAGIVIDRDEYRSVGESSDNESIWNSIINKYPSILKLFESSNVADIPGRIIKTERLQRRLNKMYGDGWTALNHTAGFVDPLHSTGIAHTLCGIEKLLKVLCSKNGSQSKQNGLKNLQENFYKELHFIDMLVSIGYKTKNNFNLFTAGTMHYFIATIRYEQSRLKGEKPDTFLCAGNQDLMNIVGETHEEIKAFSKRDIPAGKIFKMIQNIRKRIQPYNQIGLMNPDKVNMYAHTAVEI